VLTLFGSAYYGLYAYRGLVKSLSARSTELPLADQLSQHVGELRVIVSQVDERLTLASQEVTFNAGAEYKTLDLERNRFRGTFYAFSQALETYRDQLDSNHLRSDDGFDDDGPERATLAKIDAVKKTYPANRERRQLDRR
jgi:hypothetical protein